MNVGVDGAPQPAATGDLIAIQLPARESTKLYKSKMKVETWMIMTAVVKRFNSHCTQKLLNGINSQWANNSKLTIFDTNDLNESLAAARNFVTQFKDGEVTHEFRGKSYTFQLRYRDPWEWLVHLVIDPTLSTSIMWYPVEKYLHDGSTITRIYDEVNTGRRWWEIQDQLPQEYGLPHCFLPLHLWLDQGKVSHATNKHSIVLQPVFLPSEIRNASGNGGGIFIGFMPIVGNPNDSIEVEDDTPSSVELAQFKQEVYHKVLHVILKSIRKRSHHGDTLECGDRIRRVLSPGFLIHSVDGEEGCLTCGTRGANANHPCPKCLVAKEELTQLSKDFAPRLPLEMRVIFEKAKKILSSTARMSLLRGFGLHFVKVSWNFFCFRLS
ncbi:hypothetical protein M422DRAFT_251171 [Sphaerobolus stellatus SS14]|uniref:Uncharacterized protein n=1 Tax=Sphaerobolus stellatus (strain SS14) TaxID=990650 RepID=A0A0C9VSE4_SPHS4|nr:hypothetical protein M422DRAFT_251171 [Sphaerobolus stellatus SS14]